MPTRFMLLAKALVLRRPSRFSSNTRYMSWMPLRSTLAWIVAMISAVDALSTLTPSSWASCARFALSGAANGRAFPQKKSARLNASVRKER